MTVSALRCASRGVVSLTLAASAALVALGGAPTSATAAEPGPGSDTRTFDRLHDFTLPRSGELDGRPLRVQPDRYAAFDVDVDQLAAALPGSTGTSRITLPGPSGTRHTFVVAEDSVMQAGLQKAHPDIRTYAGHELGTADGAARSIRLDVSPLGVHASVRGEGGEGTWYLDPVVDAIGTTEHLSYRASALPAGQGLEEAPLTDALDGAVSSADLRQAARAARTAPDALVTRRTFRLALVTDPAYADYFGTDGQPASSDVVLAEKVILMNRVNQIYNDDFAIHLVLVDGTDQLDFATTEEATGADGPCGVDACYDPDDLDPDTGGCSSGLLTRNQFVIGQLIGADDYDIGHIMLGINGGGVAGLGVVGGEDKAAGCTGLPFPEGDFMAIDYVAHEMGHQFGANHTFDGTENACSAGNRNGATSVEPGSGSSVMAYAGICGTDDLQPHTDPYFSQRSIDEFTEHVTGSPSSYQEFQTITLRNFDTDGETVNLSYEGRVTSIVRGTSYNKVQVQNKLRDLTGANVTVGGYDSGQLQLNDGGFYVQWPGTADHPRIQVTSTTGDVEAFVGVQTNGGPGTNQGTASVTTNHAPSVTAPAAKTIPLRTPFTLTGSGTDSDGDSLLYLWEQNDVGNPLQGTGLVDNNKTTGPLFRVFGTRADVSLEDSLTYESEGENLADGNPSRTFPDMAQILADNTNAATGSCPTAGTAPVDPTIVDCYSEFLPTAAYRLASGSLTFRLTARDLFATGGGTQYDDTTLTLGSAGPFRVTSQPTPDSGQPQLDVVGGQPGTITWDVAGTDSATYAQNVRILLSTDGGQSFDTVLAQSTPNDGSADVTWPQVDTDQARIKVEAVGNYFFDVNRADFAITPSLAVTASPEQTSGQYSDSLDQAVQVTVTAAETDGSDLGLEVSGVPGLTATPVSTSASGERPGTATFSVDGPLTGPVGQQTATLTATAPDVESATSDLPVEVRPEDASVSYTGDTAVEATQNPQPVALSATVAQPDDGTPGDLTTAKVDFVDRDNGDVLCTASVASDGHAACGALLPHSGASTTYTIGSVVGGRFERDDAADDATLVVSDTDTTAPETTITSGPKERSFPLRTDSITFGFASSESGSTFECTFDGAPADCSGGSVTFTGLTQSTHRFEVAARDAAGNLDPTPAVRTFATPVEARRLTQETDGWRLRRGGHYYRNRMLVTAHRGQLLSYRVTDATKVGLFVTKQPGFGKVRVFLDGKRLTVIDLDRATKKNGAYGKIAVFDTPRSGLITIKTIRDKKVKIEGLGVYSPPVG
ncbi:M12 family metallo-peptidase [Nocardioides acrostichi]|uniref:Metallo-peptidase family M12B Reprolysin-like n=1 Tax=Nocardioides acrostichi TaxID=2784339 RepID=A0A930UYX7_9ACTN|nr:M12 family metallo-peptidase [Nocardioides acrostichi]MBF4162282.1 hypothetical protein [Nocardioides acrostichi]